LITFTSGFDGRTILASALKAGKKVKTFSLGKLGNVDVSNPQTLSKDLGIPFDGIDLGEEDYQKNYFHIAREMAQMSGGFNGFLYPHFYYGACQFPSNDILQTGYCGSELFRALHIEGAITSKEMVSIFTILDDDVLYKSLFSSSRLNFFKSNFLEKAKPAVQQHIKRIRSKRDSFKTQNHFFYWFIFTQVFPKVFGFWTSVQFEKKVIRTPFLDREFIQLLIKSPYAGCNNAFFTHQPIRRLKGQLLYAHILKDLKSPLFTQMTGKQYKPSQLLSWWGRLQIVWPYIRKRWSRKVAVKNIDNLGLISGVHRHAEKIRSMITGVDDIYSIDKVMKEIEQMHPAMSESERDVILQLISIAATLDKNENVFT
jgi:hypothetical protein